METLLKYKRKFNYTNVLNKEASNCPTVFKDDVVIIFLVEELA